MEELVAEIGSAFYAPRWGSRHAGDGKPHCLCRLLGPVLAGDKRAIFAAASHAQKAADFLLARADASAAEEPGTVGGRRSARQPATGCRRAGNSIPIYV